MIRIIAFALLVPLLASVGCKKPELPDDKTLVQGEWEVALVDLPPNLNRVAGPETEMFKDVTVAVQGDRVTVSHAREKGGLAANFTLDQTKALREIDFTDVAVSNNGADTQEKKGTTRGIYHLSGDELVVALALGEAKNLPRPTEFTPRADRADGWVIVLHLKKRK